MGFEGENVFDRENLGLKVIEAGGLNTKRFKRTVAETQWGKEDFGF